MQHLLKTFYVIVLFALHSLTANSQNTEVSVSSAADFLKAQPVTHRTLWYSVTDPGVKTPIIWGLDTAWPSQDNIRRGVAFMGAERIGVVRASFQPTHALVDGDLVAEQISWLNTRLNLVNLTGTHTKVMLNSDHPSVHEWYKGNAQNWAQLMDATTRRVQERGRTVVSIAPFNEPDYGWGQGSMQDFFNIAGELRKNPRFDSIRISGGNTLNNDQALTWYNYLKSRLDEGNTHQLAGSFDTYAQFFQTVRANGHHATNDELHNVMEAMVGVNYGMQTGIWWGTAELARGEFVKASFGERLGYAEHRPFWTAASVYRHPEGKVQAFIGSSERQANTTTYRFISKDRDVFYDGHGPQREFTMTMPGGTGYQQGQTNAERVININWGADVQPVINGSYTIVNRKSGKVIEVQGGATNAGANVRQNNPLGATYQQFNVIPVDPRVGGDFSYFTITAVHSGKAFDVYNWSLNNGGNIVVWDDVKNGNQQWYLEYAEDGWFYIRSRHSAKCIEVANGSLLQQANIQQNDVNGGEHQQWRFLPVTSPVEFEAPAAPTQLTALAQSASVRLDWTVSSSEDVDSYTIYRADSIGGSYYIIARNIKTNAYVDHTAKSGVTYQYTIRAIDKSLNRSEYAAEITASPTGQNDITMQLKFENNLLDSTAHLNHATSLGGISYLDGRNGSKAISLNGVNGFLQLPATATHHENITISTWVYWRGTSMWQRIFDFGNGEDEYMFLTPRSSNGTLRLGIKNNGPEMHINAPILPVLQWTHLAITMGSNGVNMYVNGILAASSTTITTRPSHFRPVLNYIGRSQFSDPYFNGIIDDFSIFNYALSATEVAQIAGVATRSPEVMSNDQFGVWPIPASDQLMVQLFTENQHTSRLTLYDMQGREIMTHSLYNQITLPVAHLPEGMYLIKITNQQETLMRRIQIQR